jgi:ADP-ribosylation factor GTPase-activating protein 2/3
LEGKSGFGSDDYYGRQPQEHSTGRRASVENIMHAVQDVSTDFASKFAGQAQEDFDNLKKLVTIGGSKLGEILGDLQVFLDNLDSIFVKIAKFFLK